MVERPPAYVNLERCLDRLDRLAPADEPAAGASAPEHAPPPAALVLLERLTESIQPMAGAAGIAPLLAQVRQHVAAVCPAAGGASLDEEAHAAHMERLEELFQTLEGVLYACSLPAR